MLSCATALPATRATARPASIKLLLRDLIGVSIGCGAFACEGSAAGKLRGAALPPQDRLSVRAARGSGRGSGRSAVEPGDNLRGYGFDLFLFVFVGHEDDAIDAGRQVRLELFH